MPPCVAFTATTAAPPRRALPRTRWWSSGSSARWTRRPKQSCEGANLADDPAVVRRSLAADREVLQPALPDLRAPGRVPGLQRQRCRRQRRGNEGRRRRRSPRTSRPSPSSAARTRCFGRELAQLGVICVCTVTQVEQVLPGEPALHLRLACRRRPSTPKTSREYIGKRVAGKPAKYAGSLPAGIQAKTRKFGLIYVEGNKQTVDPEGTTAATSSLKEMAKYGVTFCDGCEYSYLYDPGANQNKRELDDRRHGRQRRHDGADVRRSALPDPHHY